MEKKRKMKLFPFKLAQDGVNKITDNLERDKVKGYFDISNKEEHKIQRKMK